MTKNQSFYFSDGPYVQVLKALLSAIAGPEAFVKLLGNPHTGKSALCGKLTQYLRHKGVKVIYFDTAIESPDMLRAALAREFDLPLSSNFARILEDALQEQKQKRVILIFDDAHLLTDITLIEIYRLAEVQVNKKRLLNIVLCGEPSLDKRLLSNQEFKSLLLNVSHKFRLEPMDAEELSQFFYQFVGKAGLPGLQLDQAAMNYFFKSCKGYPGPAASMCQLMVNARRDSAELQPINKSELATIFSSAAVVQAMPTAGFLQSSKVNTLIPFAAVVLIISVGLIYQQLNQSADSIESNSPSLLLADSAAVTDSPFQVDTATAEPASSEPASAEAPPLAATPAAVDEGLEESPLTAVDNAVDLEALELSAASTTSDQGQVSSQPQAESAGLVSDSGLALVTAEERGIDLADIAEPEFEAMQQGDSVDIGASIADPAAGTSDDEQVPAIAVNATNAAVDQLAEATELVEETEPNTAVQAPAESSVATQAAAQPAPEIDTELVSELVSDTDSVAAEELTAIADNSVDAVVESAPGAVPDVGMLQEFVATWVDAWQSQSMEAYFAAYHSNFEPRYQDTQAAWRRSRRRVIGNADWIELELSDFQYIGEEAGVVEVHFWLNYRSPTYQDETQKKLLLAQEAGTWRILEEINLQVRS